eukprot:scaffold17559_cov110-Isochrysis_galbana.AAC.5
MQRGAQRVVRPRCLCFDSTAGPAQRCPGGRRVTERVGLPESVVRVDERVWRHKGTVQAEDAGGAWLAEAEHSQQVARSEHRLVQILPKGIILTHPSEGGWSSQRE